MNNNKNKTYQFTLILKNVDENTSNLEDKLYEANCDDALINFRNGAVYLNFDREAHSLEEAVISAIKNIESIGAIVSHVAPEGWVTESDVANRLNMTRQRVSLWMKGKRRASFPKPMINLDNKSPLWKWKEVIEWLYEKKIITEEELVKDAIFLENVNAALEERNIKMETRKYRHGLLRKLSSHG